MKTLDELREESQNMVLHEIKQIQQYHKQSIAAMREVLKDEQKARGLIRLLLTVSLSAHRHSTVRQDSIEARNVAEAIALAHVGFKELEKDQ